MSIFDLFDLAFSPYLHAALAVVAVCLAYPIAVAARESVPSRWSRSPLWVLIPFLLLVLTSPLGFSLPGGELLLGLMAAMPSFFWPVVQLALFGWQISLTIGAIRARDDWPRTTVPLVVLLALWDLPIALADLALVTGPMVKS
jgi:hypothetical protein